LPVAVSVGFALAWSIILLKMKTESTRLAWPSIDLLMYVDYDSYSYS